MELTFREMERMYARMMKLKLTDPDLYEHSDLTLSVRERSSTGELLSEEEVKSKTCETTTQKIWNIRDKITGKFIKCRIDDN